MDRFKHRWLSLLGICLLAFTGYLDCTIVDGALPFIEKEFGADILQFQWVASIFLGVLSVTMVVFGKFADLWGNRLVFYGAVLFYGAAALGAGFSWTVESLAFFRGAEAMGSSLIFVTSATLIGDLFEEKKRIHALGLYGAAASLGLMMGPLLGGILTQFLNWRWVFWINLPLIACGLLLSIFTLEKVEHRRKLVHFDRRGLILLILGVGMLLYGIALGSLNGWSSFLSWVFIGIGCFFLVLLVLVEEVSSDPLLDLHIFKEKLLVLAALSCALAGVISNVFLFLDPLYLDIVRKLPALQIGLLMGIIPAAQALVPLFFNKLKRRYGIESLLFFGIIAAFIAILLHRMIGDQTTMLFLITSFCFLGINWGFSQSGLLEAVHLVCKPSAFGSVVGTVYAIWMMAGSILLVLSSAIFHSIESKGFIHAFHGAITFNIIFAGLVLLGSFFVHYLIKKKSVNANFR